MSIISGTTIEYETKKHGEITSAYTYSPFFAAWNSYLLHDSSANTLCRWASPTQTIRLQKSESVAYVDVLWIVNDPLDPRLSFYTKLVTDDTDDTLQVITKLDIQKYKLVIDGYYYKTATESGTGTSETYKAAGEELPANSFITRYITHWEAKNNPTDRTADTTPVIRYYDGTRYWYWKVPDMFNPQLCNDPRNNELFGDYLVSPYDNDLDVGYLRAPIKAQNTWTYPPLRNSMLVGTSDDFAMIFDNPTEQRNVVSVNLTNIDAMLRSIACLGVYFEYDGVMYLGFMDESGQTTGEYLTAEDWSKSAQYQSDNINNYSEHIPPYVPPAPSGDEDNTDPVSTTGAPFGTGLAHYYVTTVDSQALTQISEAMGSWNIDATKKDLYRNLISCKILKPPAGIPSTPSVFEIYGVKPQYNGADITIPAVNGNPDITFGPYTISRKFNDFRDYAPYTRAEIFLPYCGWCALPSHVVGRSVSVSYFTDVIAGTVKAVVFCEANPVAEAAGVMAYDIPFAAQNVGAKIQAANTGMLAYGKAALQLSAGIGQAVATKGKQGLSSIVNGAFGVAAGYNQLSMAANENYTEISGKAGDGCALAGIDTIIIKIVRPKYGPNKTAPYVPDGFAHTVGFLSMKQAKVSAASGLILCDNVDTSGIGKATDAERAEIKRVLETGLYVNNPPE